MGKRIALKDEITIDGVNLSNYIRSVDFTSESEEIDASGFNDDGYSEFLVGANVRRITLEFIMGRASGEPHQVLWNLHQTNATFDLAWRADGSASVSSTNPELRGSVKLPNYAEGATRGELEVASMTFIAPLASAPLTFYAT